MCFSLGKLFLVFGFDYSVKIKLNVETFYFYLFMDSNNNLTEILQHSVRVAIGAATVLVETLQDSQKRNQTFEELQGQFKQKAEEFAQKGEVTEREAKQKAEEWFNQYQSSHRSSSTTPTTSTSSSSTSSSNGGVQNLTEQIISLRTELENLRNS